MKQCSLLPVEPNHIPITSNLTFKYWKILPDNHYNPLKHLYSTCKNNLTKHQTHPFPWPKKQTSHSPSSGGSEFSNPGCCAWENKQIFQGEGPSSGSRVVESFLSCWCGGVGLGVFFVDPIPSSRNPPKKVLQMTHLKWMPIIIPKCGVFQKKRRRN